VVLFLVVWFPYKWYADKQRLRLVPEVGLSAPPIAPVAAPPYNPVLQTEEVQVVSAV
jgi:hypothetical protein